MSEERVKPIRPEEVAEQKLREIPGEVFQSFNQLITENFRGDRATILQKDVVKLMRSKGLSSTDIFKNGWLDVEGVYEKAGWEVGYDKPAYNEDYEPTFTFVKRKRRNVDEL